MKILVIGKWPPIQGGVSADTYWTVQMFSRLGHQVEVVTNADEVEDEYRIKFQPEDNVYLHGYEAKDSILVHRTSSDAKHVFVPQTNPSVSKLAGVALRVVRTFKPDLIWSYYVEPYGVVALLVSKLTAIPYSIRHAGSDIGRLMLTTQLEPLYAEVFRNALAVITSPSHFDMFKSLGVSESQLVHGVGIRVPPEIFYPDLQRVQSDVCILGIYGKVGRAKGTEQLIEALSILRKEGFKFLLKAHWGGRHMQSAFDRLLKYDFAEAVQISGYVPHWRIPDFIRSCDAVLFLENNFSIAFHGPRIPLEVLCCGKPLLVTEEIEKKQNNLLKNGVNCVAVPSNPLTPQAVAHGIRSIHSRIQSGWPGDIEWPDSGFIGVRTRKAMSVLISELQQRL